MTELKSRLIDGMKFMWDGRDYESLDQAVKARQEYEDNKFQARIVEEDDKVHVYTRRVVTEVVVDDSAPSP